MHFVTPWLRTAALSLLVASPIACSASIDDSGTEDDSALADKLPPGDTAEDGDDGKDLEAPARPQTITVKLAPSVADVPKGSPEPGNYRIHMIDVGTGLSILVQGHDFNLLFDGGSNDDRGGISASGNRSRLIAYLFAALGPSGTARCVPNGDAWPTGKDAPKRKIDHVFLSHPHLDHLSMLDEAVQCYQADNVWDPGSLYPTVAYRTFVQSFAEDEKVAYHTARAPAEGNKVTINGELIDVKGPWTQFTHGKTDFPLGDGASFKILHAEGKDLSDANENSTVLSVALGEKRLLLLGDADGGERADPSSPVGFVEKFLLDNYLEEIKSDIFQVGHHGSKTSSRLEFLKAVAPSYALLSSGPMRYSGTQLPDAEVVSAIEGLSDGIQLLRTDTNDARCPVADRVGMDDGTPGGCDNYVIDIVR